ncbi:MAG: AAA family ATPase [Candidatus Vecturithrix sp.]|nr:AAA family ATPase [Candidatus Vecturithrix sp.]
MMKTRKLPMLRYFFERTEESQVHLFQGLAVEQCPDIMAQQGQSPVIFLTFKDAKTADFATCLRQIQQVITREYGRQLPSLPQSCQSSRIQQVITREYGRQAVNDPLFQTGFEQQQWQGLFSKGRLTRPRS